MPLYWRVATSMESVNGIPKTLPFTFDVMLQHGLVIQQREPQTLEVLKKIYTQEANVGYLQEGNDFSKPYGKDFLKFLNAVVEEREVKSALEIGCGGCTVLADLKQSGIDVCGIDSSSFAAREGAKHDIPVVTDFYPSEHIKERFDLIFCVDVLEHIDNPVQFLERICNNLAPGGALVVNVPDCTESIDMGDISMVIHQHLNYFERESLRSVVMAAGYEVLDCCSANYGGSLYLSAIRGGRAYKLPENVKRRASTFQVKALNMMEKFKGMLDEAQAEGESIGFYVPLRAFPYIFSCASGREFRLFDDTPGWHQCYFDGYNVCVENFEDLATKPTKILVVMSLTFGEVIRDKLASDPRTAGIKVSLLSEYARG